MNKRQLKKKHSLALYEAARKYREMIVCSHFLQTNFIPMPGEVSWAVRHLMKQWKARRRIK